MLLEDIEAKQTTGLQLSPLMHLPEPTAGKQQQSQLCFLRPTFFKLASDVSGGELLRR